MAKPPNIKPVQFYPLPELYDAIKETVDNGTYRSMNAAVIALVENALGLDSGKVINNQSTVDTGTVKQLIGNELAGLKQQILDEILGLISNSASGQDVQAIAVSPDSPNSLNVGLSHLIENDVDTQSLSDVNHEIAPLDRTQLAARLGVKPQTITDQKGRMSPEKFLEWTKGKDSTGWQFDPQTKLYHAVN